MRRILSLWKRSQQKLHQWMLQPVFIAAAAGLAVITVTVFCLLLAYSYKQEQLLLVKEQQAQAQAEQIIQEASEKNQLLVSQMQNLKGSLMEQDYTNLVDFLLNPSQPFEQKAYFLQNYSLQEPEALSAAKGQAILLDLENASLYVGKVNDAGERSGYGIQVGYSSAFKTCTENGEVIYVPCLHIYEGSFENNLASGEGVYTQIRSFNTEGQSTITYTGTFKNHQMDGPIIVSWMQEGRQYEDTIQVEQGTIPLLSTLGTTKIYARAWNGIIPVTLKVYDASSLENTYLWHEYLNFYLDEDELEAFHSKNYAVL